MCPPLEGVGGGTEWTYEPKAYYKIIFHYGILN